MEISNYRDIAAMEKNWWYRARAELISVLLRDYGPRYTTLLDLGCGVGMNAYVLKGITNNLIGLDPAPEALELAKNKGYSKLLLSGAQKIDLPDGSVDAVVAADVLEHIQDDAAALGEIRRVLKPGGILLVTVPALPALWNKNDEYSHHERRYTKPALGALLQNGGLAADFIKFWNFTFLIPVFIVARLEKLKQQSKEENNLSKIPDILNDIIYYWMRFENQVFRVISFPLGVSLISVSKKAKL